MAPESQHYSTDRDMSEQQSWGLAPDDSLVPLEFAEAVQAGDRLIRNVPYEGVQHSAVIVSDTIETAIDLAARGVPLESTAPGAYVEVLEQPLHGGEARSVGRRLTDGAGRLLRGQILLRPLEYAVSADSLLEAEAINSEVLAQTDWYDDVSFGELTVNQINWCQMRQTIAATARAEERRWTAPNGAKYQESNHPNRMQILTTYWQTVPGFSSQTAAAARATQSINNQIAWSAAFICYVMYTSGIRQNHGFAFSQRHLTYIVGALRNRERSDRNRPFWLVDDVELQREATPQNGDILCFNRMVNGQMTNHSYASLRNSYWTGGNQHRAVSGSSHTSVVVGTGVQNGQRYVEAIGGNETHSVRIRRIPVDQWGGIPNPQAHRIFGMIKLTRC